MISKPPGQAFGFAEIPAELLEFCERVERRVKMEAKIDRLPQPLAGLREMRQSRQRLLEAGDRLSIGRAREGLAPAWWR